MLARKRVNNAALVFLAATVFSVLLLASNVDRPQLVARETIPAGSSQTHLAMPLLADLGMLRSDSPLRLERYILAEGVEELLVHAGAPVEGSSVEQRIRIEWRPNGDDGATLMPGSRITRIELLSSQLFVDLRTDRFVVGGSAVPGGGMAARWPNNDMLVRGIREGLVSELLPRAERLIAYAPKP